MKVAFFLIALLLCVIASSAADLRGGQSLTFTKSSLKAESHEGYRQDDDDDDEYDDEDDDEDDDGGNGDDEDDDEDDDGGNGSRDISTCENAYVNQDGKTPVTIRDIGVNVSGQDITVTSGNPREHETQAFLSNDPQFWSSDNQGGVEYKVKCKLQADTGLCAGIKNDCSCTGGTFTVTIGENSRTVEMTCVGGVKKFCVKDGNNNCYPTSYENANSYENARRRRLLQHGHSNC